MHYTNENGLSGNNSTQQTTLSHETGTIQVISRSTLLGKEIDVYGSVEEPMFKAKDVAEWIEHSNITDFLNLVDDDEKGVRKCLTPGGNQQVWFLTEDGLYEVLMQSRKPIAKQFKKGIKEILKSIRKTGSYSVQPKTPQTYLEALEALVEAEKEKQRLELESKQQKAVIEQKQVIIEQKEAEISIKDGKIEILEPKGESYDAIMSSQGLVTINMIAAFLGISARKLNQLLCQWGVQYKQSKCYFLTYKYRDKGYTKHVPFPYLDNGVQKSREHMYWTEAGRKFVIDLYNSKTAA